MRLDSLVFFSGNRQRYSVSRGYDRGNRRSVVERAVSFRNSFFPTEKKSVDEFEEINSWARHNTKGSLQQQLKRLEFRFTKNSNRPNAKRAVSDVTVATFLNSKIFTPGYQLMVSAYVTLAAYDCVSMEKESSINTFKIFTEENLFSHPDYKDPVYMKYKDVFTRLIESTCKLLHSMPVSKPFEGVMLNVCAVVCQKPSTLDLNLWIKQLDRSLKEMSETCNPREPLLSAVVYYQGTVLRKRILGVYHSDSQPKDKRIGFLAEFLAFQSKLAGAFRLFQQFSISEGVENAGEEVIKRRDVADCGRFSTLCAMDSALRFASSQMFTLNSMFIIQLMYTSIIFERCSIQCSTAHLTRTVYSIFILNTIRRHFDPIIHVLNTMLSLRLSKVFMKEGRRNNRIILLCYAKYAGVLRKMVSSVQVELMSILSKQSQLLTERSGRSAKKPGDQKEKDGNHIRFLASDRMLIAFLQSLTTMLRKINMSFTRFIGIDYEVAEDGLFKDFQASQESVWRNSGINIGDMKPKDFLESIVRKVNEKAESMVPSRCCSMDDTVFIKKVMKFVDSIEYLENRQTREVIRNDVSVKVKVNEFVVSILDIYPGTLLSLEKLCLEQFNESPK